jgi:UDP-2,4-diacetamido-2,4,6-trideoxy-beta-L-altropyranose hydrolase
MILNNMGYINNDILNDKSGLLVLRADATSAIGTGHVMRCIALAQAWQAKGRLAIFLSHCQNDYLINRIESEGLSVIPLDKSHPDPADLKTTFDFLSRCKSIKPGGNIWLVIDGYHFDISYQRTVRESGCKILVVDDYHHWPDYRFDILLNPNIGADRLDYGCSSTSICLLGNKYVLLRKEFLEYSAGKDKAKDTVENVLITLGGADLENATLKVIKGLQSLRARNLEIKLVVGPANPNLAALESELLESPDLYEIVHAPEDMPGLMLWADVAISAAGSTCWELAFMEIPTAVVVLADNQEIIANGLEKALAAVNLGRIETLTLEKFRTFFRPLIESKAKRIELNQNQRTLIDGLGADRVISRME